jgi:predicted DCC family thiol-disulfide oxidoreductase YuxK
MAVSERRAGCVAFWHEAIVKAIPRRGVIYYDGQCSFCRGTARRTRRLLLRHGYRFAAAQSAEGQRRLGPGVPSEVKLITRGGAVFGGADAVSYVARRIWWAAPLGWLALLPGIRHIVRWIYRWIAANRGRLGGSCRVPMPSAGSL